jgi:2-succinyl-5-enolpyruvyl-6-hydroxy-3-cyclohexene-1-carboxylate synthase
VDGGSDGIVSSEAERSFSASWWLVDELVRSGMTDACVSPGSRSTPIALALWRHPHVRVTVHLDERASGFFALGLAKATARPVAVACTSGTAVAELLPAVVEASMSRVPLVLLTADRPPELRGVGANQTIDQPEIYGTFVADSIDAEVPGDRQEEAYWRGLGAGAIRDMLGPPLRPVHVNLPFREPLVPGPVELPASAPPGSTPELVEAAAPEEVEAFRREIASTARGVIVAGSLRERSPAVVELARRAAWPLVADPTSGSRVPGAFAAGQLLLADERFSQAHVPDVVVQLGAAPTSRAGQSLVARCGRLVIVDPDRLVADPNRRAERVITADLVTLVEGALGGLDPRPETPWLHDWLEADARARAAVDRTLDGWDEPAEARVARDVAGALPDGTVLVVGSSMPVRDLDACMRPREGITVIANRGASGIDGFVSTALGVAAAGAPTVALCGDLTFLHDVGSLVWLARRGPGATFVVLDNGGGTIFSFLAQRELPELDELFTTPHGVDLGAVCASAGVGHTRVERSADLVPALERSMRTAGVGVVHVVVDAELNRARHAELATAVADALALG